MAELYPGWSTSMPYKEIQGSPAPGKQDRYRPEGIPSRMVETVAVNPFTGTPIMVAKDGTRTPAITQQQHLALRDLQGTQYTKAGSPPVRPQSNVADGTLSTRGGQVRLNSPEYDFAFGPKPQAPSALDAIDTAAPVMVAMPRRRPANAPGPSVINLSFSPMSDASAQNMTNSTGKPIRFGNGKVYHPMPQYGPPPVAGAAQQPVMRPAPSVWNSPGMANYGPGTTFEQRAAAASARESLMNPPTETNWAAITASARR